MEEEWKEWAKHQRSWTRNCEGGREKCSIKTRPQMRKQVEEKQNIKLKKRDHRWGKGEGSRGAHSGKIGPKLGGGRGTQKVEEEGAKRI